VGSRPIEGAAEGGGTEGSEDGREGGEGKGRGRWGWGGEGADEDGREGGEGKGQMGMRVGGVQTGGGCGSDVCVNDVSGRSANQSPVVKVSQAHVAKAQDGWTGGSILGGEHAQNRSVALLFVTTGEVKNSACWQRWLQVCLNPKP
jgi:hypothetical protein